MSHCAGTGAGGKGPFNGHVKNTTKAKKTEVKTDIFIETNMESRQREIDSHQCNV